MTVTTPVDFINAVEALLTSSSVWIQNDEAVTASGASVKAVISTATKFSLYGAIRRVADAHRTDSARAKKARIIAIRQLNKEIGKLHLKYRIKNYNDRPTTTYANIITLLNNAKTSLGG